MNSVTTTRKENLFLLLSALLMAVALYVSFYQWREQRMSTNWMAPFLSAAQYLDPSQRAFLMDVDDIEKFKSLDDTALEDTYLFSSAGTPQPYTYYPIGYAYLIKAATLLFPFVGHQVAIILFQSLFHVLLCLGLLSHRALSFRVRMLFLVLYALNPIVLRVVTLNFYYFWQVIPSFGLLYLLLNIKSKLGWALTLLSLPLALLARSTTIFISAGFLGYLFWIRSRVGAIIYTLFLVGIVSWLYVPNDKNPWHTLYAGVGGYTNPDKIALSDESSYALYQKHTGVPLNPSIGGNFYDPAVQETYTAITQQEYLAVLKEHPVLLAKNAVAYFFAAFSVGYVNKAPDWLNYLIAVSGFIFFVLLGYHKKYLLLAAMILGIGGFVLYYPPIPAYMYGNYVLLVWGLIEIIESYLPSRSADKPLRVP